MFDKTLGSPETITAENAGTFHVSEGSHYSSQSDALKDVAELPQSPNRSVIIGAFRSYETFISSSHHSIYTEISILVDEVFESNGVSLAPGSSITTAVVGGTIRDESGRIMSFLTDSKDYFLEPGKKYLLLLRFDPQTQLFTVLQDWAIENGLVKANSRLEQKRAEAGDSSIVGLTTKDLIPKLRLLLSLSTDK